VSEILEMYKYQYVLKSNAIFLPRVFTFECQKDTCPDEIIEKHCISGGFFCFMNPNEERTKGYEHLTERTLIEENLKERCVYEVLGGREDE